jgi:hypothetical protein
MMINFPALRMLKISFLIILFTGNTLSLFPNNLGLSDTIASGKRKLSSEELVRGERLFYGLVRIEGKSINCAGCHNTMVSDTLNWNPNALEISQKYLAKTPADLQRVLLKPSGDKMAKSHAEFKFTSEDTELIKGFMDKFTGIGLKPEKPVVTNLLLFFIAFLLFLFSAIDLIIIKKVRRKWILLIIILTSSAFITGSLVVDAIALGRSKDYSPDQPVKFSHQVHAGQNGTDCIYCHSYAPFSKSAGIPGENVCMNCHLLVRNGSRSGVFEIAKVVGSYENKKPIEWVRIHNLPDHVFFSHAQHVSAGKINCSECHGAVDKMNRMIQVSDLSMGWCINCHRTREVNFKGNSFFSDYRDLAEMIRKGVIDSVTVERLGGTECMKCHY